MRVHLGLAAGLLSCVLMLGGCATGQQGSLADRFIQPGESSSGKGGPSVAADSSARDELKKARRVAAETRRQTASFGASVEQSDSRLAAALLVETAAPTAENHLRVALEYRRLGILDMCADHLALALRKAPRMAEAHEALARVWRDWGMPDQGLASAYRATYYAPRSASASNTLGTLLGALGHLEDARDAYERALSLEPGAAWALNNICRVEFQLGRLAGAKERCEAAVRQSPGFVAAHNNLALVLAASGDLPGAQREFLAAGDRAAASYNLGIVHLAEGQYASAADAFEDAIRARPTFTAAKTRAHLARARLLTGEK